MHTLLCFYFNFKGKESSISTVEEPEEVAASTNAATDKEAVESSADVRKTNTRTIRYMKLVGAAAVFSFIAMGLKRVMENFQK